MAEDHPVPKSILAIVRRHGGSILDCVIAKSAQHHVWILTIAPNDNSSWRSCLERGGNRLVVRVWKGQCRWWNLHRPDDSSTMAEHELWGYETAHAAFATTSIRIPIVLYHGTTTDPTPQEFAILEYVGEGSTLFSNDRRMDTSWADSMVLVRHEFGFDEPHPRWGRVPVDDVLEYAMLLLNQVILPLHANCSKHQQNDRPVMTFERVVEIQQAKFSRYIAPFMADADAKMRNAMKRLEAALQAGHDIPIALAPVLVHLDLQPQNIFFGRAVADRSTQIVSVWDWEEAAWADPRFELLLLGRKVCANRAQAEIVWGYYQQHTGLALGSITPWLRLETMHSLTTLLLQATTGTGRSPWETKPDLWGKVEREVARLDGYDES